VKAHTAAIFRALRVSNRTEAAFVVRGLGIEVPARGEI
jgi:DNA-binding NarL/FixJ family response regulator